MCPSLFPVSLMYPSRVAAEGVLRSINYVIQKKKPKKTDPSEWRKIQATHGGTWQPVFTGNIQLLAAHVQHIEENMRDYRLRHGRGSS